LTIAQAPLWIAKDQGFFTKQGLELHLERVAGPAQIAAMTAGQQDFASAGAPEVLSANLAGSPIALLASASDWPFNSVYTDPSIKSFKELEGKTVGIAQSGAITDTYFRLLVDKNGLTGKVPIAALGSQEGVLAGLQAGKVAGAVLSPPGTQKARDAGFVELVNGIKLGIPYANSGIAATRSYIQAHPDVVRRFLAAYQEGWTFAGDPSKKSQVVDVLVRNQQITPAIAEASYEEVSTAWSSKQVPSVNLEGVANTLKYINNPAAKTADPAQFVDNSFWGK